MPCYANSTFRIDAVATVKLTAYASSYTLPYIAAAARRKAANFQRVKNAVIRPRFQASTRAFLGRVGRASTALQIVRVAPSNCMAGIIACWASKYESGAAPDGPHRVAELPEPSTPCRTDAVVRHGAPRRQGLAGSEALGTDATAAAHEQGQPHHGPAPPE